MNLHLINKFHFSGECTVPALSESGNIDSYIAIDDKDVALVRKDHVLVVQVAQIDVRSGKGPVSGVAKLKPHLFRKGSNLSITHFGALYVLLLHNDLKVSAFESSKSDYRQLGFREERVVKTNSVKSQNRLDIIIQPDGLCQIKSLLVNRSFAPLGYSLAKLLLEAQVDIVIPTVDLPCPSLYIVFLRLSSLTLFLEAEFC